MGSWAGWAGFVPGYQGNSGGPGRWRRVQVQTWDKEEQNRVHRVAIVPT